MTFFFEVVAQVLLIRDSHISASEAFYFAPKQLQLQWTLILLMHGAPARRPRSFVENLFAPGIVSRGAPSRLKACTDATMIGGKIVVMTTEATSRNVSANAATMTAAWGVGVAEAREEV